MMGDSAGIVATFESPILLAAVAVHAPLLAGLISQGWRSNHPALHFVLSNVSSIYFPLMSTVLSYLPKYLSSMLKSIGKEDDDLDLLQGAWQWLLVLPVLFSLILIEFLKSKADMAALAMAAVTSPVAGDNIDSLKVRPSMQGLIYSSWLAGIVIYTLRRYAKDLTDLIIPILAPLWILVACSMVLRFAAFQRATGSFALGRNAQLIAGYMAQLQQRGFFEAEGQLPAPIPPLVVTGERHEDVEESPLGYCFKSSALNDQHASLVTLDRMWSHSGPLEAHRDLCLSFALFKCLRRRFAGYQLAEAASGSRWAFCFVDDGLLGRKDDHNRIFQVIADKLSFARDFYYSPLPVACLGTLPASLYFFLSAMISASCLFLVILLTGLAIIAWPEPTSVLSVALAVASASTEIWEMVASVRSNWTKISIIGHYVRCRQRCLHKIFSCLLRCKSRQHWKDEIGQIQLLSPSHFCKLSWTCLPKQLFLRRKKRDNPVIKVPPEVKAAILASFRSCGGQLRDGTAAVQRRCQGYSHDITWACHGGEIKTTTEVLLVWHIATTLIEIRFTAPSSTRTSSMVVAQSLSRYCAYLVAEAPDLLPDDSAWTKLLCMAVKKDIDKSFESGNTVPESGMYGHLTESFSADSCHKVLNKGSRLGKQLVEEAEKQRSRVGEAGAGGEDEVWVFLAEFWTEMVLYVAPSDNVKNHIEALQRGGELITLLLTLLLHAGIISRPDRQVPEP